MLIFVFIIIISIVMFIYYKVSILRTKDRLTQEYMNAMARFFLGTFIVSFGINQYIAYQTQFILFISLVFLFLGGFQIYHGYKAARHYRNEWKRLHPDG